VKWAYGDAAVDDAGGVDDAVVAAQVEMMQPICKNYHFHEVSKLNSLKMMHWKHSILVVVDIFQIGIHDYGVFAVIFD
jgi:hypothetical protein